MTHKKTVTRYPAGWDAARIQRVVDYYDNQSDEDAAAEIEAAFAGTVVNVPAKLLPAIRKLIAKQHRAPKKRAA